MDGIVSACEEESSFVRRGGSYGAELFDEDEASRPLLVIARPKCDCPKRRRNLIIGLAIGTLVLIGIILAISLVLLLVHPPESGSLDFDDVINGKFKPKVPAITWLRNNNYAQWLENGSLGEFSSDSGLLLGILADASVLIDGDGDPLTINDFQISENVLLVQTDRHSVYRHSSTGKWWTVANGARAVPIKSGQMLQAAQLSRSGEHVSFVQDNNVHVLTLATNQIHQVTSDGSDDIQSGIPDWATEEEWLARGSAMWWSDGESLAFLRADTSSVPVYTLTHYEEPYNQLVNIKYPKAGYDVAQLTIGMVHCSHNVTSEMVWADIGAHAYVTSVIWIDSFRLAVRTVDRRQRNSHLNILSQNGSLLIESAVLTSTTWVEVEGHDPIPDVPNDLLYDVASRGDHMTVVAYSLATGHPVRVLSDQDHEVMHLDALSNEHLFYTEASPTPRERCIVRVNVLTGERRKLTPGGGFWEGDFSMNGALVMLTYKGPKLPHTSMHSSVTGSKRFGMESNSALSKQLDRITVPERVTLSIKGADGDSLNGWMLLPPNVKEEEPACDPKHPLLIFVYGGPGSQQVIDVWSLGFHEWLASKGWIVVCFDGRGTGGRGIKFRHSVYGRLGELEAADQVAVARTLSERCDVDADRIVIWGWSFGGFLAARVLADSKSHKIITGGVSVAPVTSWLLYDAPYTERFMDLPANNADGYLETSVVQRASKIKAPFFLVSGLEDDNVHFQHSALLAQALESEDYRSLEMRYYPNRAHSLGGPGNPANVYAAIYEWLER